MRKARLQLFIISILCVFIFGACLDYEQTFTLNKDGSGEVIEKTTLAADPTGQGLPAGSGAGEQEMTETEKFPFQSLEELELENTIHRLVRLPEENKWRLETTFFKSDQEQQPMSTGATSETTMPGMEQAGMAMLSQMFTGRWFTLNYQMPGELVSAGPIVIGSTEYAARLAGDWVSYRVPMSALFSPNAPEKMSVQLEFKAGMDIEGDEIASKLAEPEPAPDMQPMPAGSDFQMETTPAGPPAMSESLMEYVNSSLDVRNVKVDDWVEPPEVSGEIKNNGDRTVSDFGLIIYFLDSEGNPMDERRELVPGPPPVRPNYTRRFKINAHNIGSDWSGEVRVEIDWIRFGE